MATIQNIRERAQALAEKWQKNSITPEEVGLLIDDLAALTNDAVINGSTLGIRKTYASISAMEADGTAPEDAKGNALRPGQLVAIASTDADNGKIYAFSNPGWMYVTTVDAQYVTQEQLAGVEEKVAELEKDIEKQINNILLKAYPLIDGAWNTKGKDIGDKTILTNPNDLQGAKCAKIKVTAGQKVRMIGEGNIYGFANYVITDIDGIIVDMLVGDTSRQAKIVTTLTDGYIYYSSLNYAKDTDGIWNVYTGDLNTLADIAMNSPVGVDRLEDVIDDTLQKKNHAADAEITGKKFDSIDVKIEGGNTYSIIEDFVENKGWNIQDRNVGDLFNPGDRIDASGVKSYLIEVQPTETYKLYGIGNQYAVKMYCVVDSSGEILSIEKTAVDAREQGIEITIPLNGNKLYVNLSKFVESDRVEKVIYSEGIIKNINRLNELEKNYIDSIDINFSQGLISISAIDAAVDGVLDTANTNYKYGYFKATKGQTIDITTEKDYSGYKGVVNLSYKRSDGSYCIISKGDVFGTHTSHQVEIDGDFYVCVFSIDNPIIHVSGNKILDEIISSEKEDNTYTYWGEKINIGNKFKRDIFLKVDTKYFYHQSMSVNGNIAVFFNDYGRSNRGEHSYLFTIINIEENKYIAEITVTDIGPCTNLHGNTTSFGAKKYNENSIVPLIYVSSFDGGDYINVYDIGYSDDIGYYADLIQVIDFTNINNEVIGNSIDAVVDTDNNKLITHGYLQGVYDTTGNKSCFVIFDIPSTDVDTIQLSDSDIIDQFKIDVLNFTQDKCYHNGKIYIHRGDPRFPEWLRLSVVDINKKKVESEIDLSRWGGEPEGIDIYNTNKLIGTYGYREIYEYIFVE